MPKFEFTMALSAANTEAIYAGRARYIHVDTEQGLKIQLPATNFRCHVTKDGIKGRFSVEIDADNKILALRKL